MPEIEKVVGPVQPTVPAGPAGRTQLEPTRGPDFQEVLRQQQLKLSGHAQTRLRGRNIGMTVSDWQRVTRGVDRAAAKGSRESLILVDDVALVVSVLNRTIITAVDKENLKDNVFTNIDSAVIV
jgi:flagellar operon protein